MQMAELIVTALVDVFKKELGWFQSLIVAAGVESIILEVVIAALVARFLIYPMFRGGSSLGSDVARVGKAAGASDKANRAQREMREHLED